MNQSIGNTGSARLQAQQLRPARASKAPAPDCLAVDETLHLFHTKHGPARRAFARFVADSVNADDPFDQVPRPGFLGTESFIETILEKFNNASVSTEVPKKLRPGRSLEQITRSAADRDQAITEAYRTGAYTLTEIARHFGIHQSTASYHAISIVDPTCSFQTMTPVSWWLPRRWIWNS